MAQTEERTPLLPEGALLLEGHHRLLLQREADIEVVAQNYQDIHVIMDQLHSLVQEQGGMLDDIASHVVKTDKKVEEGVVELRQAKKHQKCGRKTWCLLLLLLLVVGAGIVLALQLSLHHS